MSDDSNKRPSRRDFIKATTVIFGGFIGAAITIPGIGFLVSPAFQNNEDSAWVNLGVLAQYPIGIPQYFQFTRTRVDGWERTGMSYGVFVVRLNETEVRVFSNICTHLGCHVNWRPNLQHYVSPCHDGHFDILGKNISGPPPRPLDEYRTRVEQGNLFIMLPAFKRTS